MVGTAACDVSASTNTAITCTLREGQAGHFDAVVIVSTVGIAENSVGPLEFELKLSSLTPAQGGFRGGEVLSLAGIGFSEDIDSNHVMVGAATCAIVAASHTELKCIVPECVCTPSLCPDIFHVLATFSCI